MGFGQGAGVSGGSFPGLDFESDLPLWSEVGGLVPYASIMSVPSASLGLAAVGMGDVGDAGVELWSCFANSNSWGDGKEVVKAWTEVGVSGSWEVGLVELGVEGAFEQGLVCLMGLEDIEIWPHSEKR